MTFWGETEHFSGRIGALRWSILVGKQKHNVQKPNPGERGKKTLWTRQLQNSLPCNFETKYLTKPVFVLSAFVIDKSARGATMRETAEIIAK